MATRLTRYLHGQMTAREINGERALARTDPNYQSYYETKGYVETRPENEERPVYRLSAPLKGLRDDRDPDNLLTHQAIYVPPYTWEFQRGDEKNVFGKHKLKIEQKHKPNVSDLSDWRDLENAGTTTLTDGEIYQSCKFFYFSQAAWRDFL